MGSVELCGEGEISLLLMVLCYELKVTVGCSFRSVQSFFLPGIWSRLGYCSLDSALETWWSLVCILCSQLRCASSAGRGGKGSSARGACVPHGRGTKLWARVSTLAFCPHGQLSFCLLHPFPSPLRLLDFFSFLFSIKFLNCHMLDKVTDTRSQSLKFRS